MTASIRLSELSSVTNLDNNDLLLITDSESSTSRKLTIGDLKADIFSGNSFASFSDVDLTSTPPTDGQFLTYDAGTDRWVPGDISLSSLGELSDVDLVSDPPANGETLVWDGTKFTPGEIDLSPLYSILGEASGDTDLGVFVNSPYLEDNRNVREHLQALSNGIVAEVSHRTGDIDTLTTLINNLEVDIAPETLNSINELAAAMGDDPDFLNTLTTAYTTADTNLQTQITNLQSTVNNLDIDIAPETLNSINELAEALQDDPNIISTISNSLSTLTTTLNKLVPPAPSTFGGLAVTVNVNAGTRRLCTGFTDNTGGGSGYEAGDSIKRNTDSTVSTNYIGDVGPGDSGSVLLKLNNGIVNSVTLDANVNNGTTGALQINDNKDAALSTRDSGIQAEFYQVYDVRAINLTVPDGLNEIVFSHTDDTNAAYFYEDGSSPGSPTLTTSSIYIPTTPIYNYSSGIPHYSNSTDNDFSYSLIAQNLSGDMYINHQLATSSQTSGFTHQGNKTYTDFGGSNPPDKDFGVGENKIASVTQYPRDLHIQVSSNQFSNWTITTPYGSVSSRPTTNITFNIMGGTARTDVMDEDNILIDNLGVGAGNAYRVNDAGGTNPVATYSSWSALATPSTHEALVVGGVLKHDRTDYSTGYRPVGPNFSVRNVDPQYATFEIRRSAVSQFTISYTGECTGCWVNMPDNTGWQTSLSGVNGWADMFQAYKGSGVPTTAEPGCSSGGLMDNDGGSFTCVFGTESSSNDAENRILVRWKLAEGQAITSMSFA